MIGDLLIRADANTQTGSGHFMRCQAFAQGWQASGGKVTFLSHCQSDALRRGVQSANHGLVYLEGSHPDPADLGKTLSLLDELANHEQRSAGSWLVLDGYHFDSAYQAAIRAAGHHLLVIDDMAHLPHYHADLVLNQNINAKHLTYHCDSDTELLLGTEYGMLRPEFLSWRGWKREISETAHRVLVSLGGGDSDNVTFKVIEALRQTGITNLEVRVVVGPTNPHLESLQRAFAGSSNIQLLVDVADMPELMAWADVAVSTGGSTCWELAYMGLPALLIVLADNQAANAQGLAEAEVVVNVGWHDQVSAEFLAVEIDKVLQSTLLRRKMSLRGRETVDGDGVERTILRLKQRSITLRTITPDDCRQAWEWANEPISRGSSFSSDLIPWTQHVKWFETKLNDPECLYYIAVDSAGEPIGQVRYDLMGGEAVISVSLDAKARGNGYGSLIIQLASNQVFDFTPIKVINAYIKEDNRASIRAFAKAGYKEKSIAVIRGQQAIHFIRTRD